MRALPAPDTGEDYAGTGGEQRLGPYRPATLKAALQEGELELVRGQRHPADNLANLLRYDTAYGRFDHDSVISMGDDHRIAGLNEEDPSRVPWGESLLPAVLAQEV